MVFGGRRPSEIPSDEIRDLVKKEVRENESIDFKSDFHWKDDKKRCDMMLDLAASPTAARRLCSSVNG